jgi:hypothetical protein
MNVTAPLSPTVPMHTMTSWLSVSIATILFSSRHSSSRSSMQNRSHLSHGLLLSVAVQCSAQRPCCSIFSVAQPLGRRVGEEKKKHLETTLFAYMVHIPFKCHCKSDDPTILHLYIPFPFTLNRELLNLSKVIYILSLVSICAYTSF